MHAVSLYLLFFSLFLFQILYADSLDLPNIQVPTGTPRVSAWMRTLIDQVIKLDRNRNGSFGKLKVYQKNNSNIGRPSITLFFHTHHCITFSFLVQLKQSHHSVGARFSLQMYDISRFVTSKVPRQLAAAVCVTSQYLSIFCYMSRSM